MAQGGSQKHAPLLLSALRFALGVWERAGTPAAAAGGADPPHVRAVALATLLTLLRHRWRALAGGGPRAGGDGGGGVKASAGAHPLAQSLAAAAAAAAQQNQAPPPPAREEGQAVVRRVLQLLVGFFEAAAAQQVVLAAADVRLVLEELFELQVGARCSSQLSVSAACTVAAAAGRQRGARSAVPRLLAALSWLGSGEF
jgi:hypothetical protein